MRVPCPGISMLALSAYPAHCRLPCLTRTSPTAQTCTHEKLPELMMETGCLGELSLPLLICLPRSHARGSPVWLTHHAHLLMLYHAHMLMLYHAHLLMLYLYELRECALGSCSLGSKPDQLLSGCWGILDASANGPAAHNDISMSTMA